MLLTRIRSLAITIFVLSRVGLQTVEVDNINIIDLLPKMAQLQFELILKKSRPRPLRPRCEGIDFHWVEPFETFKVHGIRSHSFNLKKIYNYKKVLYQQRPLHAFSLHKH